MTLAFRTIASQSDLAALRPVLVEYFTYIADQLAQHHDVALEPEVPVDGMLSNPEKFLPPVGHTLVAEQDERIVGTVSVKPLSGDRVEIKRLYVRPGAQGIGLGRTLLERSKDLARDMGASEMYLDTLRSLEPAIALYRADGFEEVAQYEGAEIGEHPDILPHAIFMRRTL